MKKAATFFCLIVTGFLQAQTTINPYDLKTLASDERDAHAKEYFSVTGSATANYDVKWYRCWWNIDPSVREISGNVTTLFTPVGQGLDSLALDLSQDLSVDSVIYHNNPVVTRHAFNLLTIRFPSTLPLLTPDSVTVYYHGIPPDGTGSFVKTTHSGEPILWTESVDHNAGDWWPCKTGLTDKADSIDIYIQTPSAYNTASNGLLVSSATVGANTVYHWKHRYPIADYLINIAVTNYARYTQQVSFGGQTLDILNCVYPEDSASAFTQTLAVKQVVQFYDSLFGIYAFQNEKYGQAQYATGGMENQTMTFISSFSFDLMAHELAHSWFGDKITCGSFTDIWLNEGCAVCLNGLCLERFFPDTWEPTRKAWVQNICSQPGGSVYCPDTNNLSRVFDDRLTYQKGAMLLHQLRWIIGDSAFFTALRSYMSDQALVYGFARTSDLKAHLEAASGQDLTWYFDDWYTGQGYPSYHVDWQQTSDTVTFTLTQTQSHPSVSFFELPVPVQFKNDTRDTIIRVSNTFSGQSFTASIPFQVNKVVIDPDCRLISANNTIGAIADHSWQRNLQLFPNPANNSLTVIPQQPSGKMDYQIYSSDGRLVTTGIIAGQQERINIVPLAEGLYSIVFLEGNQSSARTFIKSR
jgi:aminopeptidase N